MAAAIRLSQQHSCSFDHLVGAGEQRRWHLEPERIRGLEVDDKLELGRLLDRQIGGPFTLEDAIDIASRLRRSSGTDRPPASGAARRAR